MGRRTQGRHANKRDTEIQRRSKSDKGMVGVRDNYFGPNLACELWIMVPGVVHAERYVKLYPQSEGDHRVPVLANLGTPCADKTRCSYSKKNVPVPTRAWIQIQG